MKHSPASFTAAIFVISILLCAPLFGQTLTAAYSLADNTPYCHGTSYSCLTSIGGVMTEIKTGADGTVYGLNSSHALYTYTHAAGWVLAAANLQNPGGLSIVHISVGSKTQVMALSSAASQNHNVYVLDASGTTWLPLGAWLSPNAAEIGSDGTV